MSVVQITSRQGGPSVVLVDGHDIAHVVTALTLTADAYGEAVLMLTLMPDKVLVDVDGVQVVDGVEGGAS